MDIFNFSFKLPKASESITTVITDPKIYLTLLAIIALGAVFMYITKVKMTTQVMVQVALAIAIGTVLKMFCFMKMPMGGSVTIGSMVPIIFIAYIYGPRIGCFAGIVFGILDLLLGAYVVHPIQLILDYVLAFGALGVAGYFKNNIITGTLAAIFLRTVCHVISGVVFFASYAGEQNVWIYSILYNGTYLLPEAVISVIILVIIPLKRIQTEILKTSN
jgi:thiamine transporter